MSWSSATALSVVEHTDLRLFGGQVGFQSPVRLRRDEDKLTVALEALLREFNTLRRYRRQGLDRIDEELYASVSAYSRLRSWRDAPVRPSEQDSDAWNRLV